jgi:hypothetical protein
VNRIETPALWEYLVIPEADRDQLDELGCQGWELVALGGDESARLLYLKRRAPGLRERVTIEQRERYYRSRGLVAQIVKDRSVP